MTFPAAYDTLTRVTADDYLDTLGKEGDVILDQIQDAIEATQAAIGKTGETAPGTVEARLAALPAAVLSAVFGAGYTRTVFHTAKPWILPSNGTLNAGVAGAATITGMATALPRTYAGPGKIYVPAVGSWGGGWMDFLSATTTTITLTDAVATGGSYDMTSYLGIDIAGPSYTLTSGAMGNNGLLEHEYNFSMNSSAGGKLPKILAAAQAIAGGVSSFTTSVSARGIWYTAASGSQSKQSITNNNGLAIYAASGSRMTANTTVDFSVDQTVSLTLRIATLNDILILERWTERLTHGS